MDDSQAVDDLYGLVANGDTIDWGALDADAQGDDVRDLIEQLQIIAEVAVAHRAIEDPPTPTVRADVGIVPAPEPTPRNQGDDFTADTPHTLTKSS